MVGTGYCAENAGELDTARADYLTAIDHFAGLGVTQAELFALNAFGNASVKAGDYRSATDSYERVADLAAEMGHLFLQAMATNNLGTLDFQLGDPGRAAARFESAAAMFGRVGNLSEKLNSLSNAALSTSRLGRNADAIEGFLNIAATADSAGFKDLANNARIRASTVRVQAGDPSTAAHELRILLAHPDGPRPDDRSNALVGLADALAVLDSVPAGLEALDRNRSGLAGRLSAANRLRYSLAAGRLLNLAELYAGGPGHPAGGGRGARGWAWWVSSCRP